MSVRALDENGDWTWGKGRQNYLTGKPECAQNLSTRCKSILGDCFFAVQDGIDWFSLIGGNNPAALDFALRAQILNTPNVTGIIAASVPLDEVTRVLTPNYSVATVFTNTPVTGATVPISSSNLLDEMGDILTTEDGNPLSV